MYLCEPAARHSVAWEEKAQWLSYSLQKRVENQPVSALCRTCSSSPQLLLCAVSLQLPAVLQVAAPACCHVGLITTHHLLGPSLNLAQRKQPTAAGRQTGNQQAGGEAESTVSAPADQCKGTSRRNPHSRSCPQHTHTHKGALARAYARSTAAAAAALGRWTHSPCLPPHTLQMLLSCCTVSARGIRSST